MNCEESRDLIVDSLMDSLDAPQSLALNVHLQDCDSCAGELRDLQEVWKGLSEIPAPLANPNAATRLKRSVEVSAPARETPHWWHAAAAIALFLAGGGGGYLLGGPSGEPATIREDANTFLLLVRGDQPDLNIPGERLEEEYRAWGNSLASRGLFAGGEKLTDDPGRWIAGTGVTEERSASDISGYFLVRAANYDEAVVLAKESPHIKYGGSFEIRGVDSQN